MAAFVADYNADVKERDVKEKLHPVKNATFITYLFGHAHCKFFLSIK